MPDGLDDLEKAAREFRRSADFDFVDPKAWRLLSTASGATCARSSIEAASAATTSWLGCRRLPGRLGPAPCRATQPRIGCAWASIWTPCPRPRPPWSRARSATRRHPRSVTSATSLATSGSLTTRRRWSTTRGDSRLRTCAYAAATRGMSPIRTGSTRTAPRTSSDAGSTSTHARRHALGRLTCAGQPDAPSDRLTPFLQGTVLGRTSVPLPTGVQFVEGRIVKKALVAATMAVGLLLASARAAEGGFPDRCVEPAVLG